MSRTVAEEESRLVLDWQRRARGRTEVNPMIMDANTDGQYDDYIIEGLEVR